MAAARLVAAGVAALVLSIAASAETVPAPAGPVTILDGSGVWRALCSFGAPLVQTPEGVKERRNKGGRAEPCEKPDFNFMTLHPPPGWTQPDFDDSVWPRRHFFAKYRNGESDDRAGGGSGSPYLRQLSLRGKFTVTDPAKVGPLALAIAYRGGMAVYLNGKELTRAHLPAGKLEPGSPAEAYPLKACVKDDGKPWHWWEDRDTIGRESYPSRERRAERVPIPPDLLRKGTNVLAVDIHAAAWPEAFLKAAPPWATCGLIELHLQADRTDGIVPNVARPAGVQVWNTNVAEQVHDVCWADPAERLQPILMVGARGGVCSGRVVVSSDQPLKNLRGRMGELVAADGRRLPAAAVKVWYGKFDHQRGSRWGGGADWSVLEWGQLPRLRDDALLESPPDEVPVSAKDLRPETARERAADGLPPKLVDGALQPVWVISEIPKDAAAGDYRGKLAITLDGHEPIEVPVELKVIDWTLPDPADYACWMGMIESPEAVALAYDVPPWSERHAELVARSLAWIGKLGPKVLYLPLGAESQYGNAQSMVLWVKGADSKYTHDFSRVERYLDLALKHLGKPRFVVAGVWDSCSHVSAPKELRRDFPRFSVLDPASGKIATADGPRHGTEESLAFWQPVLTGLREILATRGLADAMLLGFCADREPDKATVGVFHKILPDVAWQATRHPPTGNDRLAYEGGTVPIRYQANVWGGWDNWDPATRRVYGWKYPAEPSLRAWLDRGLFDACPISQFRAACEQSLLADRRGLGQIGADFWPVKGPDGRPTVTMVGRFPATSEGNLGIYAGQLLYPGPDGPVPTVRYQMMRENIQEGEARIFLERLLTETPPRLTPDLAKKIQDTLDERTRWHRVQVLERAPETFIAWPYTGWQARTAALYAAAGEATRAAEGR